jgi:hypothetical protein
VKEDFKARSRRRGRRSKIVTAENCSLVRKIFSGFPAQAVFIWIFLPYTLAVVNSRQVVLAPLR